VSGGRVCVLAGRLCSFPFFFVASFREGQPEARESRLNGNARRGPSPAGEATLATQLDEAVVYGGAQTG
jgi:hypothetical protein